MKRKEYKVGEVFERDGKFYRCVIDPPDSPIEKICSRCALRDVICNDISCVSGMRESGDNVHFECDDLLQ